MKDEPYESPLKPFGGMEQITWSPDSKVVAYTCRKKKGMEYALSTNSDIYLYDLGGKKTTNLTEGMMGYDVAPVYSPDGKKIAWQSMERDGYESDKNRLFIYDFDTKIKTDYTKNFDQNAEGLAWTDDSKSIYFISDIQATDEIYRLDIADGKISRITNGVHDYTGAIPAGKQLIATRMSMSMPVEIYSIDPGTGKDTQLTFTNKDLLDQLKMASIEKRWTKTTDNKEELTWIIYPPNFDKTKKYPTLLYCEGGPQSTVSQFWSYRWNFQMMAANGYIIVAPNRRGLPGFGQKWNEEISGDYGGQNMKDYLSAIDAMSKEPFVNKDKLGCIGASYGGFSVYWLAGNHHKRFKAFIAHDGMFDLESQYLATEEMWFVNWDLGGPFWDKNNKVAQRSFANSPSRFIQNWDTPILVIHSELDYRIPVTQGMEAFNAAILRKVPAEFLSFPDENHWVLKPQNGILWQRTFYAWLDKWLK
jgi:dipeptidyl aminopeptidase/acylaminoacyl peptidase